MLHEPYYPKPFYFSCSKAFSADNDMLLDFPLKMIYPLSHNFSDVEKLNIIDILNGITDKKLILKKGFLKYIHEDSTIYLFLDKFAVPFLIVRGWGKLTGQGINAYKLSSDEASKIQESLGNWIVNTLIKHD